MDDKETIVKVRLHYGSSSLDLTIPKQVSEPYKINPGDVFKLAVKNENNTLVLEYERIYSKKSG